MTTRASWGTRLDSLPHLDQLIRHQPVGFTMHRVGGFLVRSLDQTEGFAGSLIEPVLVIRDSVLLLNLHILFVRTLDRLSSQAIDLVMNIHIQRHREPPHQKSDLGPTGHCEQRAPQTAVTELSLATAKRRRNPPFGRVAETSPRSRAICLFARKATTVGALLRICQQVPESTPGHEWDPQSPGHGPDHWQAKAEQGI